MRQSRGIGGNLRVQRQSQLTHAHRLRHIHAIAFDQPLHGLLARVTLSVLSKQINHHPLAQGTVTWTHFLNVQGMKQAHQHRQTACEHLCTLFLNFGKRPFGRWFVEHQFCQLAHALTRDGVSGHFHARIERDTNLRNGFYRTR